MSKPMETANGIGGNIRLLTFQGIHLVVILLKVFWLSFWLAFATLLVFPPLLCSTLVANKGFFAFQISRFWARIILAITGARVVVHGETRIEKGKTYIIISNHQSHFDGPAIALSLGIQFRWVAKQELLKIPIFGHCLYACGNIFIDRSNRENSMRSIQEGIDRLPKGVGVMFFAEGTRSSTGSLGTFKKGGFLAAIQTGFPILPVTVNGSNQALPKNSIVFAPATIDIFVDDPIDTREYTLEQVDELKDRVRGVIKNHLRLQ